MGGTAVEKKSYKKVDGVSNNDEGAPPSVKGIVDKADSLST